eukprot:11127038-Alexandrium_andersonii.AAC.1
MSGYEFRHMRCGASQEFRHGSQVLTLTRSAIRIFSNDACVVRGVRAVSDGFGEWLDMSDIARHHRHT